MAHFQTYGELLQNIEFERLKFKFQRLDGYTVQKHERYSPFTVVSVRNKSQKIHDIYCVISKDTISQEGSNQFLKLRAELSKQFPGASVLLVFTQDPPKIEMKLPFVEMLLLEFIISRNLFPDTEVQNYIGIDSIEIKSLNTLEWLNDTEIHLSGIGNCKFFIKFDLEGMFENTTISDGIPFQFDTTLVQIKEKMHWRIGKMTDFKFDISEFTQSPNNGY